MAANHKESLDTCKRPLHEGPPAIADHVVIFGERNQMRLPVCADCAVVAQLAGFEAHALALDEDWSKLNAL